jgi:SnoaL-like domain
VDVIDRYIRALQEQDWAALADTISEDLYRVGPFGDVVTGKQAYVEFLSSLLPTLVDYRLEVTRVHPLVDGGAVVELSEYLDVDGVNQRFPEAIFFGLDGAGKIARVTIYIQQLGAAAPVAGGSAAD